MPPGKDVLGLLVAEASGCQGLLDELVLLLLAVAVSFGRTLRRSLLGSVVPRQGPRDRSPLNLPPDALRVSDGSGSADVGWRERFPPTKTIPPPRGVSGSLRRRRSLRLNLCCHDRRAPTAPNASATCSTRTSFSMGTTNQELPYTFQANMVAYQNLVTKSMYDKYLCLSLRSQKAPQGWSFSACQDPWPKRF
eukprot:XP_020395901.1 uncharacterized protein LOC100193600 isoform X1 [Zea mays]